ncbi:hypothetical protein GOBAR_AA16930 [Gossypium barbadense]|uniref:SWIB domain-containing protein n=1 Tax=Gossypium barbadense TaxID=3634 RepID=A0A2P5XK56_GOSBA|nr:hypothetical protein GOBAR_AA16930 [Gossypium barbadense]
MAVSSATFSTFVSPQTVSFSGKPSSLRLLHPTNVRMVRTLTQATASKTDSGPRKPRGIMKPRPVSPEMQALVGVPEIPRTEVLKQIWAYIKEHNLQGGWLGSHTVCDEEGKGEEKFEMGMGKECRAREALI